jgi:hypothetical protein
MQPFDRGTSDRRYDDVFEPAIRAVGLEPYRVDRDPSVSIPIEDIENGIMNTQVCFAEITTDNPNVWFELGYAIAAKKQVCLVCSSERQSRFPFDVQHRKIIRYEVASKSDFEALGRKITERLTAMLERQGELETVAALPTSIQATEGLTAHEMVALSTIMQERYVSPYELARNMEAAGFTKLAASVALTLLERKGFVQPTTASTDDESYTAYMVTTKGEDWVLANQDKLVLRSSAPAAPTQIRDEDIPF